MKIIKKKVQKRITNDKLYLSLVLSLILFLITQTFLRTENIEIMRDIQDTEAMALQIKINNEVLLQNIQELSSYSRIAELAEQGGLGTHKNVSRVEREN